MRSMRRPMMFAGLALAALLALGAEYNPLRGSRVELAARGSSTTARIASRTSGAVSIDNDLATSGGLTLGSSGGGDKSFKIYSATPGGYAEIVFIGGHAQFSSKGGGYASFWADANSVWLASAKNKDMYFDAGGLFNFRDCDADNATRLSLDSASGNLNLVTGGLQTAWTTRLDNSGNATLATATVGSAKDWGKLAAAPGSPGEGDTYYDTALHKRRTWDGTAWQNHW